MANLIFAQYVADAIVYTPDGKAYHYIGTTSSAPNADVGDIGSYNIPTYTFAYADPQGKTAYSKCEHAVSFYLPANYATATLAVANTEYTLYTAPSDGVARVWILAGTSNKYIYVNGTLVGSFAWSSLDTKTEARGLNLNSGDVVSVKATTGTGTGYCGFLPDTY